jgi:hypothetical protein
MACQIFKIRSAVENSSLAKSFVKLAKTQKPFFTDIFPWEVAVDKEVLMIIAATDLMNLRPTKRRACSVVPRNDSKICGWMTAVIDEKRRIVYLCELSCRSAVDKDPKFKGVAYRLFEELRQWCVENDIGYIFLYPLNETVASIYRRWGLTELPYFNTQTGQAKSSVHQFYKLDVLPSMNNVAKMSKPIDYESLADSLTESQNALLQRIREHQPKLYDNVRLNIEGLIVLCEDGDELEQEIGIYLKQFNNTS